MFVHCVVVVVVFRLVVRIILEMGGGLFLFIRTTITWLWSSIHCFNYSLFYFIIPGQPTKKYSIKGSVCIHYSLLLLLLLLLLFVSVRLNFKL